MGVCSFRGDDEHVFKNFVRLERRRRRWLDKKSGLPYEWGDVVNGVDLGDEENRRLFDEFNKLPDEERAKFQFGSLGLSKVPPMSTWKDSQGVASLFAFFLFFFKCFLFQRA